LKGSLIYFTVHPASQNGIIAAVGKNTVLNGKVTGRTGDNIKKGFYGNCFN